MLPTTLQFLAAMLAYAINERIARKMEYMQEEIRTEYLDHIVLFGEPTCET